MTSSSSATDSKREYSTVELLRDLWGLMKGKRFTFVLGSLMKLFARVLSLYPVYAFAKIVSFFSGFHAGISLQPVWTYLALWFLSMIARIFFGYFSNWLVFHITVRTWLNGEVAALYHVLLLDISWHEHENTGNKLKRINRGAMAFDGLLRLWHNQVLTVVVSFVGVITIIAMIDIVAAGSIALYLIVYYVVASRLTVKTRTASRAVNIAEEEASGLSFEVLNNVRTVKVLGMTNGFKSHIQKAANNIFEKFHGRVFWFQLRGGILDSISSIFTIVTLVYIVYGISQGRYNVGFLVLFFGYFEQVTNAIDRVAELAQDYLLMQQNIVRLKELTDIPVGIDEDTGKRSFPKNWQTLTLSNVSFHYRDNEVLKNITLEINRGEKIGIVGLSGAGKSTLFKLLLKEYEDYTGDIMVNDVALKNIRRSAYLDHIAVVMQETEVFNFSLKENIVMANPSARRDKAFLSRAMQTAHVTDFISKLPEGVDTLIGEKGVKLSGGEKQRLGIARAIFKKPEILFMDEATSHLDLESEEKIRDSLHKFFKDITAVVIAHRLTTVKLMDRIIVLEGGRIIEQGTFDQLMKQEGRFYTLWQKQQL